MFSVLLRTHVRGFSHTETICIVHQSHTFYDFRLTSLFLLLSTNRWHMLMKIVCWVLLSCLPQMFLLLLLVTEILPRCANIVLPPLTLPPPMLRAYSEQRHTQRRANFCKRGEILVYMWHEKCQKTIF